MDEEQKPKKPKRVREEHSDEFWLQMRGDYERGATSAELAVHYEVKQDTIKKRAWRDAWIKVTALAPPPLKQPPPEEEIARDGDGNAVSAWTAIAHRQQLAPKFTDSGRAWSTWLFQGGRGAGKTRAGAEWLAARAEASPHGLFALDRRSMMCAKWAVSALMLGPRLEGPRIRQL